MMHRTVVAVFFFSLFIRPAFARETPHEFAHITINGRTVSIVIPAGANSVIIPNLHAPLVSKPAADNGKAQVLEVTPLVDAWEVKVAKSDTARQVDLVLGAKPQTIEALKPIVARPDGGFDLPAHLAHVVSEKLRYELQPWKNTVGYWVVPEDYAYFVIRCNRLGKWNVGILQGCGTGQGGSQATISLHGPIRKGKDRFKTFQEPIAAKAFAQFDFQVEETGHFQNFQWRHVGELSMDQKGLYALKVSPKAIANNALMDFRAISLTPIPEKR